MTEPMFVGHYAHLTIPTIPNGPKNVEPRIADADYYRRAAHNIRSHFAFGNKFAGSNLTETVARLCDAAAETLESDPNACDALIFTGSPYKPTTAGQLAGEHIGETIDLTLDNGARIIDTIETVEHTRHGTRIRFSNIANRSLSTGAYLVTPDAPIALTEPITTDQENNR